VIPVRFLKSGDQCAISGATRVEPAPVKTVAAPAIADAAVKLAISAAAMPATNLLRCKMKLLLR